MRLDFSAIKTKANENFRSQYGVALATSFVPFSITLLVYIVILLPYFSYGWEEIIYVLTKPQVERLILLTNMLLLPFVMVLYIGTNRVFTQIYRGWKSKISDVLWGFQDFKRNLIGILPILAINLLSSLSSILGNALQNSIQNPFDGAIINERILAFQLVLSCIILLASLTFWMTPYILADSITMAPSKAFQFSMRMSKGYRLQYFLFSLSFVGWLFLCIITMGLALFYVAPYMDTARAGFYAEVRIRALEEGVVSVEELA